MRIKANILIDQIGNPLLADFGLATIISDPRNFVETTQGPTGGTVRWMSPELIDPRKFGFEKRRLTVASDCYALGMVIYEIISGHIPFHKIPHYAVPLEVSNGIRPLRDRPFPDRLWEMTKLCWETQPDARPRIRGVLECLESISNSQEPPISPSAPTNTETWSVSDVGDSTSDTSGTFFILA
jgi:serine/threonine protein kinase